MRIRKWKLKALEIWEKGAPVLSPVSPLFNFRVRAVSISWTRLSRSLEQTRGTVAFSDQETPIKKERRRRRRTKEVDLVIKEISCCTFISILNIPLKTIINGSFLKILTSFISVFTPQSFKSFQLLLPNQYEVCSEHDRTSNEFFFFSR